HLDGVRDLELRINRPRRLLAERPGRGSVWKCRCAGRGAAEAVHRRPRRSRQLKRLLVAAENRLVVHESDTTPNHCSIIERPGYASARTEVVFVDVERAGRNQRRVRDAGWILV